MEGDGAAVIKIGAKLKEIGASDKPGQLVCIGYIYIYIHVTSYIYAQYGQSIYCGGRSISIKS